VFLGGTGLPQRWAGTRVLTIVETKFGLGPNLVDALLNLSCG
jgi:tRNA U34 5-methylaminomethyl-2-thiouridine-forming methyltransferase MnmC